MCLIMFYFLAVESCNPLTAYAVARKQLKAAVHNLQLKLKNRLFIIFFLSFDEQQLSHTK